MSIFAVGFKQRAKCVAGFRITKPATLFDWSLVLNVNVWKQVLLWHPWWSYNGWSNQNLTAKCFTQKSRFALKTANTSNNKTLKKSRKKKEPTILIQVEIILIAELLRATSKEYIVVSKEVLKAGDLVKRVIILLQLNMHRINEDSIISLHHKTPSKDSIFKALTNKKQKIIKLSKIWSIFPP